jgi:hypothetical protein
LPATLEEQNAVRQAMSNPAAGKALPLKMTDLRWPGSEGWFKMQQMVESANGTRVNVHYVFNPTTGAIDDFKIVMPGPRPR